MFTVLGIIALLVVLFLLLVAYGWWMDQGVFGWFMAWNLLDTIGHVCAAIVQLCIALLGNSDS